MAITMETMASLLLLQSQLQLQPGHDNDTNANEGDSKNGHYFIRSRA